MQKNEVIEITNRVINGTTTTQDVVSVIYDFCIEKDATKQDIIKHCIPIIISSQMWKPYFKYALEHFKRKFSVIEILSAEEEVMTPVGPKKIRKTIKAY